MRAPRLRPGRFSVHRHELLGCWVGSIARLVGLVHDHERAYDQPVAVTVERDVVTQAARGQPFSVTFSPPSMWRWHVRQLAVEIPNYVSGAVQARVTLDGAFVFGTNQGQNDVASGAELVIVGGQLLVVTWSPVAVAVPFPLQGRALLTADQQRLSTPRA